MTKTIRFIVMYFISSLDRANWEYNTPSGLAYLLWITSLLHAAKIESSIELFHCFVTRVAASVDIS